MPWKETSAVDQRLEFVLEALAGSVSFSKLCRRYGVSRETGYATVDRFRREGAAGLVPRPSVPKTCPHRISDEMAELLIAERKVHGWGPRKLLSTLQRRFPYLKLPAPSTV